MSYNSTTASLNVLETDLYYNMDHSKPGKCLVFDHEQFNDPKNRRHGTKNDVERIKSFFESHLGFEMTVYTDLTKAELIAATQQMAKEDFTDYSCFVCCILSHGTETHLFAHDGKYKLESIISFFTAKHCPTLAGKPKLFFIQACKGTETDPGFEIYPVNSVAYVRDCDPNAQSLGATNAVPNELETLEMDSMSIHTVTIPIFSDILVAFSTIPRHYSFRRTSGPVKQQGSWFFEVLIKELINHFEKHDLLTILEITKKRIAIEKLSNTVDPNKHNKKQIPWITDTLIRRVLFKAIKAQSKQNTNYDSRCERALYYDMNHINAGKCLIFDHKQFNNTKENPQRSGTEVDAQRIETFFKDKLGFEVSAHRDVTLAGLFASTQQMSKQDFTDYSCFVCCILTHGTETHLKTSDGKYYLDQIIGFFTPDKCKTLAGKPKLFFIQGGICAGDQIDSGHEIGVFRLNTTNDQMIGTLSTGGDITTVDSNGVPPIVTVKIPIFADILVAYSAYPKHDSHLDPETGSWFFQVLMETLEEHYEEYDLLTILTITKRKIAFEKISEKKGKIFKQIPWITDTITRKVCFKLLPTQTQNS